MMLGQTAPVAMRLRAQSTIVVAAGRAFQPNIACALAELKGVFSTQERRDELHLAVEQLEATV